MSMKILQINRIWRGNIALNSWNKFFDSKINIDLNIGGDKFVESINFIHTFTYEYLITNQEELLQIILNALLVRYPAMQKEYGYEDPEVNEYMPDIESIKDVKKIVRPKRIYILDVEHDGIAYVGFCFSCSWDEEHDLGVMMHKKRVIKIGLGEVAFLSWIAEEDKKAIE